MKIRPATLDDMESLLVLQREVHDLHVAAEPHRYRQPTAQEVRRRFIELLDSEHTEIVVAEAEDQIVGYMVARYEHRDGHAMCPSRAFILVDALAVASNARRRGVGRRLMDAASDHARALDCEGVELDVRAFNHEALAFYEALGFKTEKRRMSRPWTR